jgi:ribulose-5-phosphate 4-epimerase/fuculose-1-phosphate aldolase
MRTDAEAREQIVEMTRELFAHGHLTATGGNLSATGADAETIWITPSGLYKGDITVDALVCIREDGTVVAGSTAPSIEFPMHWRCYRARPGSTAAVHTHAPAATAFGITGQSFPPINTDAIALADTQIVPWFMPGSTELAAAVSDAIAVSRGAILQCHGLMAVGETMRKAGTRAMMLEETARLLLYCRQFGGDVAMIPPEWVARLEPIKDFL